jgi:hypothetical protein
MKSRFLALMAFVLLTASVAACDTRMPQTAGNVGGQTTVAQQPQEEEHSFFHRMMPWNWFD